MNSYLATRPLSALAAVGATFGLLWLAATPAGSAVADRSVATNLMNPHAAAGVLATLGCPYPPGKPAARGSADAEPAEPDVMPEYLPHLIPPPVSPIRPAIYYEVFVPVDEADRPKIVA